jgi:hypothetical protein
MDDGGVAMPRARRAILGCWALVLLGCAGQSPGDEVAERRARYTATLNGFLVRQEPLPAALPVAGEAPSAAGEAGITAGAAETEDEALEALVAAPPESSDVLLDIVVQHDSREKLAGITLEVGLVDAGKREKEHYRIWVDTSQIERGPGTQVSYLLEDVPYEEGDGFFVEVRADVPPPERGLYREFAGGAPAGGAPGGGA